jgi:hypothetical protein
MRRARPLRIVIAGGPRTGKTTLAASLGLPVFHTDDLIPLGWVAAGAAAADWIDQPGPWVIEGVTVARALRRWLKRHDGAPCDLIAFLARPAIPRTRGQEAMAKGCAKIFSEIAPLLAARGVRRIGAAALRGRLATQSHSGGSKAAKRVSRKPKRH